MTNDNPPPERPTPPNPPSNPSTPSSMPRNTPMSGPPRPPSESSETATPPRRPQQPSAPAPAPAPAATQAETAQPRPATRTEDFSSLPFPLQDGERVLGIRRKHWIFLWPKTAFLFLVAIIPVLVMRWLLDQAGLLDEVDSVLWIVAALWVLFWGIRAVLTWYRYRHDFWVITSQRLIDCRRRHPFDLTVSTADLVNVQDMSVHRNGVLATVLDFGNIVCQTASADAHDFTLTGIPNPRETQILVDRERDRERLRVRGV